MFSEEFELVVAMGEEHWADGDLEPGAVTDALAIATDVAEPDGEVRHQTTSIGRGASGLALVLIFSGLSALFFGGKKFEENLDAWIRLANRLNHALQKFRTRKMNVYLSESAAAMLALRAVIGELLPPMSVKLVFSKRFVVDPATAGEERQEIFRHVPERFYLYAFEVSDGNTHVVCMRSSGAVEFHQVLLTGNFMQYHRIV